MIRDITNYTQATELLSANQTITTSWVDVGAEIDARAYNYVTLFLKITGGTGANNRVRLLVKHTKDHADEYTLPITDNNTADIKINDQVLEFADDATIKQVVGFDVLPGTWVQVQVSAGTANDTLTSCMHALSWV